MSANERASSSRLRSVALYLAGVCLFLVFVFLWSKNLKQTGLIPFTDATVYARALTTWKAGGNPYALNGTDLAFVYPPIFLPCAAFLGSLIPRHDGWYVYLVLQGICLVSVPWLLTIAYIRSRWLTPFFALLVFTFQPLLVEEYVLLTGNVANLFYPLALATGIVGIKRNRWLPFYLVVAIAALLKPTFLDLLLLPLIAGRRQLLRSALCAASVATAYLLQRIFMPLDYARFQQNVFTQVILRQDSGFNLFNYLHRQGRTFHPLNNPLVLSATHFAIVGTLVAAFFLLRNRRQRPTVQDLWLPGLLVTTILASPRLQKIDAEVAILPAIYLCIEGVRRLPERRSSLTAIAVAFTAFAGLCVKQFEMGLIFLLYASVLLTIFLLYKGNQLTEDRFSHLPEHHGLNESV
jgi:hypothetical protein